MPKRLASTCAFIASLLIASQAMAATVLITGSNRGIGLGLVERYADAGWTVIATSRSPADDEELKAVAAKHPDSVMIEEMDVTDDAEIASVAAKYDGTPIDLIINNAGVLGDPAKQALGSMDYDDIRWVMEVNVYGPLKVSQAFLDHVKASDQKKIVTMTSGLGSMTITSRLGRFYGYRMSKAAVNMAMRAMQADLRAEGVTAALIAPGMVETSLLAESGYRGDQSITVEESTRALVGVIDGITLEGNAQGLAINYDGQAIPW